MIKKASELNVTVREAMKGGPGAVEQIEYFSKEELLNKGRLFGTLTLKPGCGIGEHQHDGEQEYFYVVKGTATYNDDGVEVIANAGDCLLCEDGHKHGVVNKGEEDLVLLAVILLK